MLVLSLMTRHVPAGATDDVAVAVTLLDGFAVTVDGRDVTPTGIPALVIKALAVHGVLHVEELVTLIWPDADSASGRMRLRSVLVRLRRSCGGVVERQGECLTLTPGTRVDAWEFSQRAGRAVVWADRSDAMRMAREAWLLYRGDLLPFDTYVEWTATPRQRIRQRAVALLDLLADDAAERGRPLEAATYLEQAVELDPHEEERYLDAVRLLLELGRRHRAALMLDRAREVAREVGRSPSHTLRQIEQALSGPARAGE